MDTDPRGYCASSGIGSQVSLASSMSQLSKVERDLVSPSIAALTAAAKEIASNLKK
jgi:transcriptional regulator with XRE-family HTH domain